MSEYIELPIETDPQDIMDDFVTFMQTVIPGWEPAPGNLDAWIAQGMSLPAAESRDVASAVPRSIFRWFGSSLISLPPIDAAPATSTTTWVVQNTAGYTIPAGTQVSIAKTGDEVFAFETVVDVVIPPGSTTATNVVIIAVEAGADASALGGAGVAASLLDPLAFVTSVTLLAATSGGVDAETDDAYLGRLTEFLTLLAPRPILPADFAALARNIAGVQRATAINGYNPLTGSTTDARTVAVAAIDAAGLPVSAVVKAAIKADLESRREVNFIVNVIDPTINKIDVTYTVKAVAGQDLTALVALVNSTLQSYLNAATWGSTNTLGTDWINTPTIRYLEVAALINSVPGVDYITTTGGNYDLTIALDGNALARADLVMTGIAPLPAADTLVGTAT